MLKPIFKFNDSVEMVSGFYEKAVGKLIGFTRATMIGHDSSIPKETVVYKVRVQVGTNDFIAIDVAQEFLKLV